MFALLERLIFFLFIISLVRSVIRFITRLWHGGGRPTGFIRRPAAASSANRPGEAAGGATMLHQDPICGTYVAADTSLKRIFHGKVVHFCSAECRDRYRA
jgi:YHS domain-containing protein